MHSDSKTAADNLRASAGPQKPPLNWDGGKHEAPANRGAGDTSPPAGREFSNGDRGDASGRNLQDNADVTRKPTRT